MLNLKLWRWWERVWLVTLVCVTRHYPPRFLNFPACRLDPLSAFLIILIGARVRRAHACHVIDPPSSWFSKNSSDLWVLEYSEIVALEATFARAKLGCTSSTMANGLPIRTRFAGFPIRTRFPFAKSLPIVRIRIWFVFVYVYVFNSLDRLHPRQLYHTRYETQKVHSKCSCRFL